MKSSLRNLRHSVVRSKRYFKDFEDNIKLQLQQLNIAEEQVCTDKVHGCVFMHACGYACQPYIHIVTCRHSVMHLIKSTVS